MPTFARAHPGRLARSVADASRRRGVLVAAIALAALALGIGVYLVDRPPGHALLLPRWAAVAGAPSFGAIGDWLPSFVHPLAFALLTALALPAASPWRYRGCVAWGAVDVAFELGQHPALKAAWRACLDVSGNALLGDVVRYFLFGTFDVADLVATLAGAFAAAAVLRVLDPPKEHRRA